MTHFQAERQLILLSAGTAARRRAMRERAGRLMAEVDWSRLAETLRLRTLLPALGPRILELAEGRASDDFAAAVEQAIATGRQHRRISDGRHRLIYTGQHYDRLMSDIFLEGPGVPAPNHLLGVGSTGEANSTLTATSMTFH